MRELSELEAEVVGGAWGSGCVAAARWAASAIAGGALYDAVKEGLSHIPPMPEPLPLATGPHGFGSAK